MRAAAGAARGAWAGRLADLGREHGASAALLLLVAAAAAAAPHFATAANLWNVLLQVTPVVLVGVGMTLVLVAGAVVAAACFLVTATRFGRCLVAVGGNETAARLAGVDVKGTRLAAYVLSGLLAGLAGVLDTARLGATDPNNVGAGIEFS